MYLVLTKQSAADSTIPTIAPRIITEDPKEAVDAARKCYDDAYSGFVSLVVIYNMVPKFTYSLIDGDLRGPNCILAMVAWRNDRDQSWIENFYDVELAAVAAAG